MGNPDKATSVVTGVTSGLGRELLAQLAARGGPVIAVSRPGEKSRAVLDDVRAASGNAQLHLVEADLSSLMQISGAAKTIVESCRLNGIRRLILNAATLTAQPEWTEEGFEKMFAVNHLGAAALALALEAPLKRCAQSQICVVSSDAHRWVEELSVAALLEKRASQRLSSMKTYGATKLAGLVFFNELARRWPEVTISAHHPGFVSTNLGTHGSWFLRQWWRLSRWRMRDPGEAAVELLSAADGAPHGGGELRYWEKTESHALPEACSDRDAVEALWRTTMEASSPAG